jgi:hypothetical protein
MPLMLVTVAAPRMSNGTNFVRCVKNPNTSDISLRDSCFSKPSGMTLAAGAPTPQAGDMFDILNFNSVSGAFATLNLPVLSTGLAWNTYDLLTTGTLRVIAAGDYNGDGNVDAADYVVWRKHVGTPSEYDAWRANFGRFSGDGTSSDSSAVPESATILQLSSALAVIGMFRRRQDSDRKAHKSATRTISRGQIAALLS